MYQTLLVVGDEQSVVPNDHLKVRSPSEVDPAPGTVVAWLADSVGGLALREPPPWLHRSGVLTIRVGSAESHPGPAWLDALPRRHRKDVPILDSPRHPADRPFAWIQVPPEAWLPHRPERWPGYVLLLARAERRLTVSELAARWRRTRQAVHERCLHDLQMAPRDLLRHHTIFQCRVGLLLGYARVALAAALAFANAPNLARSDRSFRFRGW